MNRIARPELRWCDAAMMTLPRRALLALPLLAAPAVPAAAARPIPPFAQWVGRTALLRGTGGAARLLLADDGSGLMSVRMVFFCRTLPIRAWALAEDGEVLRYRRAAALDPDRIIAGEARILREEGRLLWIETARNTAEFEGFAAPDLAGRCG